MITVLAGLLSFSAYAADPEAQPLVSLEEKVKAGAATSAIALHCAGLFHSVWDFTGEAALGPEASALAKDNAALFLTAGKRMRRAETGSADNAVKEAFDISSLYHKRYTKNVANGRDAYASDAIWNADLDICRNLSEQL